MNLRNYLIGALQLQGAKRISEVLEARIEDVDWEADAIHFIQKKSDVLEKRTQAFFPGNVMRSLREYLGERDAGHIFITRSERGLSRFDVRQFYQSAYKRVGINKKGLTHMLEQLRLRSSLGKVFIRRRSLLYQGTLVCKWLVIMTALLKKETLLGGFLWFNGGK